MEYNDFPILDDAKYKLMQDKFNEQFAFNRKENVFLIYLELNQCVNSIPLLFSQVNSQICEQLKLAKQNLDKLISNFEATFNLPQQTKEIRQTTLFNLLKNIAKIEKNLINWLRQEQKEYFKQFALNAIEEIFNNLTNLLNAVDAANLKLFKYI